jgi:hypothetical protein
MQKFAVDYNQLENNLYKKSYKLSEVKDRIVKVAFDIVKFKDGDEHANLWQIQNADDGDYIVSMYEESEEVKKTAWDVSLNKLAGSINISYKNDPIITVASRSLGIPANELSMVKEYLPVKLAENKKLVRALLNELPETTKNEVLNKYPELS